MLTPPYKRTVLVLSTSLCDSLSVCCASSLVGERINACNLFSGERFCSIGSKNANVFPLPVLLLTIRSFPASKRGIDFSCTSVGCSYFNFWSDANSSGFRFNSLNFILSPNLVFDGSCRI